MQKTKNRTFAPSRKALGINLKGSYFVGDKFSDVQCALAHECKPLLVKTGYGEITLKIMILLKLKFLKIYCQQQNLSANDFIRKIFSLLCDFRNFFNRHIFNLPSLYFY